MKATGIVRRLDSLGRVVIPMELRRMLHLEPETPLEFFTADDGTIALRAYTPGCSLCGEIGKELFSKMDVCSDCIRELQKEVNK